MKVDAHLHGHTQILKTVKSSLFSFFLFGSFFHIVAFLKCLVILDCPFRFRDESMKKFVWSSVCKDRSSFRVLRHSKWTGHFVLSSF